eukprot:353198-Rhodomonas_salina.2
MSPVRKRCSPDPVLPPSTSPRVSSACKPRGCKVRVLRGDFQEPSFNSFEIGLRGSSLLEPKDPRSLSENIQDRFPTRSPSHAPYIERGNAA